MERHKREKIGNIRGKEKMGIEVLGLQGEIMGMGEGGRGEGGRGRARKGNQKSSLSE